MKSKKNPLGRKDNLVIQELDGEVLIYDLSGNKAFCLNKTSALVWQACDGDRSVKEISKFVSQQLNSPANEDLVWFAIDQLKKENLLENSDDLPNNFAGMTRREAVKKVGLGSLIALPVVASMVTPASAQVVRSCTQPGDTFISPFPTTNCNAPAVAAACVSAAATQCCSAMSAGATNCDNPNDQVTCACAPF